MSRLSKFLFGLSTNPSNSLFGLTNGQIRHNGIINSAGWFNENAEKLGYGDLAYSDIKKIRLEIKQGEMFIAISEADTFWNIPNELDKSHPGKDYIIQKAKLVITNTGVLKPSNDMLDKLPEKIKVDNIEITKISYPDLFSALGYKKPTKPTKQNISTNLSEKQQTMLTPSVTNTTQTIPVKTIAGLGTLYSKPVVKNKKVVKK